MTKIETKPVLAGNQQMKATIKDCIIKEIKGVHGDFPILELTLTKLEGSLTGILGPTVEPTVGLICNNVSAKSILGTLAIATGAWSGDVSANFDSDDLIGKRVAFEMFQTDPDGEGRQFWNVNRNSLMADV